MVFGFILRRRERRGRGRGKTPRPTLLEENGFPFTYRRSHVHRNLPPTYEVRRGSTGCVENSGERWTVDRTQLDGPMRVCRSPLSSRPLTTCFITQLIRRPYFQNIESLMTTLVQGSNNRTGYSNHYTPKLRLFGIYKMTNTERRK